MVQDSNDRQFWSGSQCGDLRVQTNQTTANIIANQSQDYIDEQLAEFQEQIHRLQGKSFLNFLYYDFLVCFLVFGLYLSSKFCKSLTKVGKVFIVLENKL